MGSVYTQVEDYLLPTLALPEEGQKPIGILGQGECWWHSDCKLNRAGRRDQRHTRYLEQHHKVICHNHLTSGKLDAYFADIDEQAEDMFPRLVKEMAEKQGETEQLKATDQMTWVGKMNNICNSAMEVVNKGLIFV